MNKPMNKCINKSINKQWLLCVGVLWLCCWFVVFSVSAETNLLVDLRSSLLLKKLVSGHFLQCAQQDGVVVSARGRYLLAPEERLELVFVEPKSYSLIYFSDGSVIKKDDLGEDKPRYSSLGNLIFSMISFDRSVLDRHFEVQVSGTQENFLVALSPKKRLKKRLQSVSITGVDSLISAINITAIDHREIKIMFGTDGDLNLSGCG